MFGSHSLRHTLLGAIAVNTVYMALTPTKRAPFARTKWHLD